MSSSSTSSSSSGCCSILFCEGDGCQHLSNWNVSGLGQYNSDNCVLYASFDTIGGNQQVELYKDSLRSQLVAVGQRIIFLGAGWITLSTVNGSGLSGMVAWDGNVISSPSLAILACEEFSSSSTLSTSSSSSSSSEYSESSLSTDSSASTASSSGCCVNYICRGTSCVPFSAWTLYGVTKTGTQTDNCQLYVLFDYVSGQQQIKLYTDPSFVLSSLVAIGQGLAGTIAISQRNGSGISGTVVWNNTAVYYPDNVIIACFYYSSSSSSSSSSYSSSSSSKDYSSSSSSYSTSSLSSLSSSSSNSSSISSRSTVSEESSSSSSIDSSSSSSESGGNTSTSSLSVTEDWNKTKPLLWGTSAINSSIVFNRLAQTITLVSDTWSVGKVYCYFYGLYGTSSAFTLHLDICNCNDEGKPLSVLSSSTIPGSSISGDGWYAFNFNVDGDTPTNKYLSFVMWQENGNEDNYVLWGYNPSNDIINTKAWLSSDNVSWTEQTDIVRAMKIIGSFNAYDLTDFRILTPPAERETITQDLIGGINNGTKFIKGDYQYAPDKIVIDYPNVIISFVIDSSGSMGWNDRLNTRKMFIGDFIQKFKQYYPSDILVDMVKFGAMVANTDTITANIGKPMTIKIDLNTPTRSSYVFNVFSANVTKDDIYEIDGYSFTVLSSISDGITVFCLGDGSALIPDTGTLVKTSGSGDISIPYTSYVRSSVNDVVVAYGFKNFENKHQYYIGDIVIGTEITQTVSLDNWQSIVPGGEVPLSIGSSTGPKDTSSLNLISSDSMTLRRPISTPLLQTAKILNDVSIGDTLIQVDNTSLAQIGNGVDLVNTNLASLTHTISNVFSSTSTIELASGSTYNIGNWNDYGSIMQQSAVNKIITISGTTAELLVKDVEVSRSITFFIQTFNGLMIEWDFEPYDDWYVYNIYWMDETAVLPVSIYDRDGNPFPDGTEIDFYVNSVPEDASKSDQIQTQGLIQDASSGSNQLFLDSTEGYSIGNKIDIINNKNEKQSTEVIEVGTIDDRDYIKIVDVLLYDFNVSDESRIVILPTLTDEANVASMITQATVLPASLSLVDITPIYTGKSLNPSLLMPYDPPPLSPSTTYGELNLDIEHVRTNINEVPTIDGIASIRILPITEDNLKTLVEKTNESARAIVAEPPPVYVDQSEQTGGDFNVAISNISNASTTTTTTTLLTISSDISPTEDYTIDSPVYLSDGEASSSMTTFATTLTEETFEGVRVPGISNTVSKKMLVKKYEIYPAIVVNDFNNTSIAKQFLNPFDIYFTPPYSVFGTYVGDTVTRIVEKTRDEECPDKFTGYTTKSMNGVYASSDTGFSIEYTVMSRGVLSNGDTLRIRIYSNTVANLANIMQEGSAVSRQDLSWTPPQMYANVNGVMTLIQPLSEIDTWREAVENNPISQTLQDTSESRSAESNGATASNASFLGSLREELLASTRSTTRQVTTSNTEFGYYTDPQQWTKATQCGVFQDIEIPVVNGKAVLEVPASVSDVEAILLIQASMYFGNDNMYEYIRSDIIAVANPIDIAPVSPSKIFALGGNDVYEIGTSVTWNEQPIDDNVVVNFKPERSECTPAISKTSNVAGQSWAGGINIGPHATVTMTCPAEDVTSEFCLQCWGVNEEITVSVSYLNYTRTVTRILEWTGELPEEKQESLADFYFFMDFDQSNPSTAWASSTDNYVKVVADLDALENITWAKGPHEDGIDRLLGYDQDKNAKDTWAAARKASFHSSGLSVESNPIDWSSRVIYSLVYGLNRNIGITNEVPKIGQELSPYFVNISGSTAYIARTENDTRVARIGFGASAEPYTDEDDKVIIPKPQLAFIEPLNVTMEVESYDSYFIRNGVDSPNVVATVTWEGQPILDKTAFVNFEAGICRAKNTVPDSKDSPPPLIDNRGTADDCIAISKHPDVSLTSNSVTVSLSRTDINTLESNSHTHSCQVNSSGDGNTTDTIILSGYVASHTHNISNYIALNSGDPSHTHQLRSVAVTKLNPTINPNVTIAINGYAWYDPTSCEEYSATQSTPLPRTFILASGVVLKRMMFSTLYLTNQIKDRKFELSMTINDNVTSMYTAEHVTDTDNGINIVVTAKFSPYSVEDYPGHWIIMPEQVVPDGTRIIFDINTFKPLPSDQVDNMLIIRPDTVREYMYISAKATVFAEGLSQSIEKTFIVLSKQQWLPSVEGLLISPTTDDQYIASALNQIDTLGASQIHDAVYTSAQRLIDYQTANSSWKNAKKIILLLTDGDENTSAHSISQAINNVNFIDGNCQVPLMPLRLGYSYGSDDVILKRYADKTCGYNYYLINATEDDAQNVIDDMVTGGYIKINSGYYMNTIDLGQEDIAANIELNNVLLPYGSRVLFRYRFSTDNINWNTWSEWYDSSTSKDLDLNIKFKGRYFQYQIYLYGNSNFESPELLAGITLSYYKVSTFAVFFQPVDLDIDTDEYLASIHITHKADIPVTSIVNYGYTQFDSVNPEDYYSVTRPLITSDRHAIILNRYNEIFLTQNNLKYIALNGRWAETAQIEVYRIVSGSIYGELVDPSKYASNYSDGSITFYNIQDPSDKFVLCVYFDPAFRVLCNVINYGPESVVIDHIGIMYNISKRIPKDSQGNIIHAPLSERL